MFYMHRLTDIRKRVYPIIFILLGCMMMSIGYASSFSMHDDPVSSVIFWVTLIYFLAIAGRYLATRCYQSGVLGELVMGVCLGNILYYMGSPLFTVLREGGAIFVIVKDMLAGLSLNHAVQSVISVHTSPYFIQALKSPYGVDYMKVAYVLDIFSRYGVIFLLFKAGLESSLEELKKTGWASLKVAIMGVFLPILFGFLSLYYLMPSMSTASMIFVSTTLCATSVGITIRVFDELKALHLPEVKIILGAAIIDDILGLIILSMVSALVTVGAVDGTEIMFILFKTTLFFLIIYIFGYPFLRFLVRRFSFLSLWEIKLFTAFIFVMVLSWFATMMGLSSIIGAFFAGILLHDEFFKYHKDAKQSTVQIASLISPLEAILSPLFFMLMGIQVKLETFFEPNVLVLALILLLVGTFGKILAGFGGDKGHNPWLIGFGMLPRGEVGIVFASIGKTLGVVDDAVFSAIILMVIMTTFLAPLFIKTQLVKENAS